MTDFERGAEAMQRACARVADNGLLNVTIAAAIRALRLPAQPPGSESREARMEKALRELINQARLGAVWHSALKKAEDALAPDTRPSPSSEKQRGDKT